MAKAPRPGTVREIETDAQVEAELSKRIRVTCAAENKTYELEFGDLGPREDRISMQQTGYPVSAFFDADRLSALSVLVIWWVMLRRNGQPNLQFSKVESKYRDNRRFAAAGFEVQVIDADGNEVGDEDYDDDAEGSAPEV
jgi:hypothetical protein